jgi:hypothetical protein
MKKVIIGYFTLILMMVFAGSLSAQAADTAELTLTGQVPSLVRIGFGSLATETENHDFGDLTAPAVLTTSLRYLANVSFDISAASANNGVLALDGASDGFANTVGYTLTWDGGAVDLSGGTANLTTATPRGIGSFGFDVAVTPVSLEGFDDTTVEADVPAQGSYTDTITFTITANE